MAQGGHSEGIEVGQFCAVRTDKCSLHENEYQKNCTPKPTGWQDYSFKQGKKQEVVKKHEAHHLLCVACVTEFIGKDAKIKVIVKQTNWCINDEVNMFAMPLWGHTIKWYCNAWKDFDIDADDVGDLLEAGDLFTQHRAPKFKNIPQHDYDHNSEKGYKQEIDIDMRALAAEIAKIAKKNHKAAVDNLKKRLESLSEHYRTELQRRGSERCGGTHEAWKTGMKNPEPDSGWYEPFSMANDGNADPRTFPAPGTDPSKLANKIKRLVEALGRWGST